MKISQRKAGALLSYILTLTNAVIGFIYIPILIYYLGKNEYGLYQLIGSILIYLGLFDFGLSNTVTRYYSKYIALKNKKAQENLLALSTIIYGFLTLLLITSGLILYISLDNIFAKSLTQQELISAKKMFIVVLISVSITISTTMFNSVITANERFIFLRLLALIETVMRPIVVLAVFQIEASAFTLVLVQAILSLLSVLIKIYYSFKKLQVRIKLHKFDLPLIKEMLSYSFFIFLQLVMDQIFWKSDQIILGIIDGTNSVAIYSIATQIVMYYMTLSTAISGVFLPSITKKVTNNASNNELTEIFIRIGRLQYILLGAVMTGFILYGNEFLNNWIGEGFQESYYITLIIMLPFTIDLIQNIGLAILQAKNMYAFRAILFSCMAVVNIIITIPLAIKYGGIGAAISTGIAYIIGNGFIMNNYYYKKVGLDIFKFWKEIFKLSVPILITTILGIFINNIEFNINLISLITKLIMFVIIYTIIIWFIGMNNYEKNLIKKPITSILKL